MLDNILHRMIEPARCSVGRIQDSGAICDSFFPLGCNLCTNCAGEFAKSLLSPWLECRTASVQVRRLHQVPKKKWPS
jgi:hypothetical protein